MIEQILAGIGLVGAAFAWFYAYRARGEALDARTEANTSADRARLAETARDAATMRAGEAEARAAASLAEFKAADARAAAFLSELERERREKAELYEKLAKAGIPVGGVLVDSAVDRLYPDGDGRKAGEGGDPGAGRDRQGVPGDSPTPTDPAAPKR